MVVYLSVEISLLQAKRNMDTHLSLPYQAFHILGIDLIVGDPQIFMPFDPFAIAYPNCHNK